MIRKIYTLTLVPILAMITLASCAPSGPQIRVEDAWVRPDPLIENGAGYFTIYNDGDQVDTLVGIQADFAVTATAHQTVQDGDISRMQSVPRVEIPPGGQLVFEPLSFHVMLMDLDQDVIKNSETVSMTLVFEKTGEVVIEAEIRQGY